MNIKNTPPGMLLHGMQAIADYIGVNRRVAYHMAETRLIPTFKMGRSVCANRASVSAALREREAAGQAEASK